MRSCNRYFACRRTPQNQGRVPRPIVPSTSPRVMTMKHAADKKADRESRRKDLDAILKPPASPHNPYANIAALRADVSRLKVMSKNSGNVNSSAAYGSHSDNSTITRISKG